MTARILLALALLPSAASALECMAAPDAACWERAAVLTTEDLLACERERELRGVRLDACVVDAKRLEAGLLLERSVCRAQREDLAALAFRREGEARDEGQRKAWTWGAWGFGGGVLATLVVWILTGVR